MPAQDLPTIQQSTPSWSPPKLFPVLLVNFIGTMGFSIVLPFLIVLVLKFGGNELIYGFMGATYAFFQLIGAPILGRWSDKYGRKKILLLSQIGTFIAWAIFLTALVIPETAILDIDSGWTGVFVVTLPLLLLFLARALDGLTGGNVSIANAYLADISTDETRKSNFGKMAASANLGFIIGPAMAGVLGATAMGEVLPVLAAMGISLVAIFVISLVMQESNPCVITSRLEGTSINNILGQEQKECYEVSGADNLTLRAAFKLDGIGLILTLYFMIFLAFNFFYVVFPVHAIKGLEWTLLELGTFFSMMGAALVIIQGPVLTRLSSHVSDIALVVTGGLFLTISFPFFMLDSSIAIYAGLVLMALGNGVMWPSFLSILSKKAGSRYQGAIQGYASSMGSAASIVGLIAGGFLYGIIGAQTFLIPAMIMCVAFILALRLRKNPSHQT